jgi:hypothetical protein
MKRKFDDHVLIGLVIGAILGICLGAAMRNIYLGFGLGALGGVFFGWFVPIDSLQKRLRKEKSGIRLPWQAFFTPVSMWRLTVLFLMVLAVVIGIQPIAIPPARITQSNTPNNIDVKRALHDLKIVSSVPRLSGSPGIDSSREYLFSEFEKLGLQPEITNKLVVRQYASMGWVVADRSHDLVARLKGADSSGAILVAGHLDSANTSYGASDCGGCSVNVLEAARALTSSAPLRNDVIFLVEDGEETTRAGALAFVEQHPWAKDVRVAINMESMGTRGASLLYVTGPENGWLVNEALKAMPSPVAYSFVNDLVWLTGTGGSDLDQFLEVAPVGLGLVYLGNTPAYHTFNDNVRNLDRRSLQHQGENVISLVRHFGDLPLNGVLQSPDLVYYNLTGHIVIQYPAWVGIALALLAAVGYWAIISAGVRQEKLNLKEILLGGVVFLPFVLIATLIAGSIWYALRYLDTRLQVYLVGISYDREWYTLAFVLLSMGLVMLGFRLLRRQSAVNLGIGVWTWWVFLAVLTAILKPGVSPFFTIPAILALFPMAISIRSANADFSNLEFALLGMAAFGIILIAAPIINFLGIFSGRGELTMGLPLVALLPAFFAGLLAGVMMPICNMIAGNRCRVPPVVLCGIAVLILLGVGVTARFSPQRPKPNMVAYVQEQDESYWVTLGANIGGNRAALLDEWTGQFFLQGAQETSFSAGGAYAPEMLYPSYRSPAPRLELPTMEIQVLSDQTEADGQRNIRLQLHSPMDALLAIVAVQTEAPMVSASLLDKPLNEVVNPQNPLHQIKFALHTIPGEGLELGLVVQRKGIVTLDIEEHVYSLPEIPGLTIRPRPDWMLPSPTILSDATILRHTFTIPNATGE